MNPSASEASASSPEDTTSKPSLQSITRSGKLEAFFSSVKKSLQLQQEISSEGVLHDGATASTTNTEDSTSSQQKLPPPVNEARSTIMTLSYNKFFEPLKDEVVVDQQHNIYGRSSRIEESHPFFDGRFRETDDGFIDFDPDWVRKVEAAKDQRRRRRRVSAWGRNAAV